MGDIAQQNQINQHLYTHNASLEKEVSNLLKDDRSTTESNKRKENLLQNIYNRMY